MRNFSVRRRLFSEDDGPKTDNFTNALLEDLERERKEKMLKWNFDTENDVPLEGDIVWTKAVDNKYDWIGVVTEKNAVCDSVPDSYEDNDEEENLKVENEATPVFNKNVDMPLTVRKRKMEDNISIRSSTKKKLRF